MVEKRPFTTRNPLASRAAHGDPHLPRTWERSRCAVPTTVNEHGLWIFQPRCRQALRAHNAVGMYPDPGGIASSSSIVPVDCITICQRQAALLSSGWHRQATSLLVLHTTSGALYRYDLARQPSYHRPPAAASAVPADSDNVLAPNTSVSTAPSGTASRLATYMWQHVCYTYKSIWQHVHVACVQLLCVVRRVCR